MPCLRDVLAESAVFVQPSRTWIVVRWERVEVWSWSRRQESWKHPEVHLLFECGISTWTWFLSQRRCMRHVVGSPQWQPVRSIRCTTSQPGTQCMLHRTPHFRLSLPSICIQMFEWTHQCPQRLPGLVRGVRLWLGGSFSLRSENNRNQAQVVSNYPSKRGINLIHFFDFFGEKEERCSRKFDRLLCCFDPLSITPFDSAKNANRFEKCNVFGNGKCEFSANQEGRNWGAIFLARKSAKLVANTKVHIFGKEKCKTHRQF